MKLEQLVPSRDLCEKIPAGKFADSALVWRHGDSGAVFPRQGFAVEAFPAPTGCEILDDLKNKGVCIPSIYYQRFKDGGLWIADGEISDRLSDGEINRDSWGLTQESDPDNPANAAMKLWFDVEGIK